MEWSEYSPNVAVQDLLDAGLHFGHQTHRWNPKMKKYIFGQRNGIYIIDLNKSLEELKRAMQFIYQTAARGRKVLFVGTKKQAQEPIIMAAERVQQPYVVHRWLGGTLTNNVTIRKSIARMREIEKLEQDGAFERMPKKEVARMKRELEKLRSNLLGIKDMSELPGAVFVVDTEREKIAVSEANRLKIPVVAIVDTNSDPDLIDYPIPGNDDAIRSIDLICKLVAEAIEKGTAEYSRIAAEEIRQRESEQAAAKPQAPASASASTATAGATATAAESAGDTAPASRTGRPRRGAKASATASAKTSTESGANGTSA